jgi:hypothetical protein
VAGSAAKLIAPQCGHRTFRPTISEPTAISFWHEPHGNLTLAMTPQPKPMTGDPNMR